MVEFDDIDQCDWCNHNQMAAQEAQTALYIRNAAIVKAVSWLQCNAVGREAKQVIAGLEGALAGKLWRDDDA